MSLVNVKLNPPDFTRKDLVEAPDVHLVGVEKAGVAPSGFYLTDHQPTYYKVDGQWQIPPHSSLNCVARLKDGAIEIVELCDLLPGDQVVIGRKKDGSEGILPYAEGFPESLRRAAGMAVETSSTRRYQELFELMRQVRKEGGKIIWTLGPSVVFDHDTRLALSALAEAGYVQGLLGGNAILTHDLEGGYIGTALGQDIYTQESMPLGHYNHLDTLNDIRRMGSIQAFIDAGHVKNGFVKTLVRLGIPFYGAGSIRDDGPLPEVTGEVHDSLRDAKACLDQASLIISLATQLHSVSNAELASSYRINEQGAVLPVIFYNIDVTENVTNKVSAARGHIAVRTMVTNVQDFVVNTQKELVPKELVMELAEREVAEDEALAYDRQDPSL